MFCIPNVRIEEYRGSAMNKDSVSQTEVDEKILTFDVSDDALERSGSAEQYAFTLFYCTNQSSECGLRD